MKAKIAIIGRGNVGSALQRGLERAGHEVKSVGRDPDGIRAAAAGSEIVILAVPYPAVDATARELGDSVKGKVVIDVINALTPDLQLAIGFTTSAAEELQKKMPGAKVVKAFNTIFADNMATGKVKGEALTVPVAGNDPAAKEQVIALARGIGFDAVDAGPLQNCRYIEPMGYLAIQLGLMQKMGTQIGFKLIH